MSSMGGSGSSDPTAQQQQLMTNQALTTANLNIEENAQRKTILNSMMGTRVFRGSALSRSVRGNAPGSASENAPPASQSQLNSYNQIIGPVSRSLLDEQARAGGSGSTPSGGTGGSGGGGRAAGGYGGPAGGAGGGGRGR